jgi:hypothetical protein
MPIAPGLAPATDSELPRPDRTSRRITVRRATGLALAAALTAAPLLAGCGSGSSGNPAAAAATAKACTLVSEDLSDGPDPGADPVGYAEAQIKPLQGVRTSDPALHTAIAGLAAAYQQVFATNASAPANRAVTAASKKVDAICPGATS